MELEIRRVAPDNLTEVALIHALVKSAFAGLDSVLSVPTSGGRETLEAVKADLLNPQVGGILAWTNTETGKVAVGTARYHIEPDHLYVGRVAVRPDYQGRGIGQQIMRYIEQVARDLGQPEIRLGTRLTLASNVRFYQQLGYVISSTHPHEHGNDTVVSFQKQLAG